MEKISDIHSVVFVKPYSLFDRHLFLKRNGLKAIKRVHPTSNTYRYRIIEPSKFKSFSTKPIKTHVRDNSSGHVNLIIGYY